MIEIFKDTFLTLVNVIIVVNSLSITPSRIFAVEGMEEKHILQLVIFYLSIITNRYFLLIDRLGTYEQNRNATLPNTT